jgi:hypothetical protein
MKTLILLIWLCLGSIPTFAYASTSTAICPRALCQHRGAPAPLIGLGAPVALVVGGVLLGAKLLKRRK